MGPVHLFLVLRQYVMYPDAEGVGEGEEPVDGDACPPVLHPSQERPVDPGFVGQRLLGEPSRATQVSEPPAERDAAGLSQFSGGGHTCKLVQPNRPHGLC